MSNLDGVRPLPRAHAHNDYEHERPLVDALNAGFCSVEADVYWVDGKLLVAHDRDKVSPDRTLESLYLEPLRDRIKANKGSVYGDGSMFWLLVDVKADADASYAGLKNLLSSFPELVGTTKYRPVTIVISGARPIETLLAEDGKVAGLDGRSEDIDSKASAASMPWLSESWFKMFSWTGIGQMPDREKSALAAYVKKAHQHGRKVRFWGFPDTQALWKAQFDAGVDFINTDRLDGLRTFLLARMR